MFSIYILTSYMSYMYSLHVLYKVWSYWNHWCFLINFCRIETKMKNKYFMFFYIFFQRFYFKHWIFFSFDYRKGELIITYIGILENLIKYKKKSLMTGVFWSIWRVANKIQTLYTYKKNFVFLTKWMQKYNYYLYWNNHLKIL